MHKNIVIILLILLLASPTLCSGKRYEIIPQWLTTKSEFRTATVKGNVLTDSYSRFNSDTFNIVDIEATGEYALNISFDVTNLHGNKFRSYPTYDYDANGKIKKMDSTRNPIYGWVIGMKDREHYNAVLIRSAGYDDELYDDYGIHYSVVTINGKDTTYHVKWTNCRQENYTSDSETFPMWIEYKNGTLMMGGGWIVSTPWSIVHGINSFGNYTGLYLGSGASVRVENVFIAVNDKETLPPTDWDTSSLYNYFNSNNSDGLEGFWDLSEILIKPSNIKLGGDYSLGIVRNEDAFDIIYLSGATKYPGRWKEGCIKGRVSPNGEGYYEGIWYDAEGEKINNVELFYTNESIIISFPNEISMLTFTRSQNVDVPETYRRSRTGSGFMINTDGYLATNHHVIEGAKKVYVGNKQRNNGVMYKAEVVISDSINDLAILRITDDKMKEYPPMPYGISTRKARLGEEVFYMGYPKPTLLNTDIKTSTGMITAENGSKVSEYMVSINIDSGSSGSPVFDKDGFVVGVIFGRLSIEQTYVSASFAVKTPYLVNLIEKANIELEDPITYKTTSEIKELSHPDKLDAIAPYIFLILVEY